LTIEAQVTGVSEAAAALERGRAVMLVTPPAAEQAVALWDLLSGGLTIIVCSDGDSAQSWAEAAPPALRAHAATGLDRSARLLKEGAVGVLAGTPEDLQALATRSALKLDAVTTVVLAWPEWLLASDRLATLEQLLGELRETRRLVLSWNPPALEDLLERHARRPHVVGDLPLGDDARPLPPVAAARYAVAPRARRGAAVGELLDALNRPRVAQWRAGDISAAPADAILCLDLPTRAELAQIARRGEPVLLLASAQLPYARTIAAPLTALTLPAARDRAATAAEALRARVAARLEAGGLEPELGLLEPLLQRYDAAEVAAALLALDREPRASGDEPKLAADWVKVFVNVGRKDRASAKDFVGALTREVGLARTDIGRVELRDAFSLLEIAPHVADKAIAGLTRSTIRGRRPDAHRDRDVRGR
jgi:ATP-dependent RNA helicase DeaD